MRSIIASLTLVLLPGVVGCGDDNPVNPDARVDAPKVIDGPPDTPGAVFKGYDADEGGEVRVEYVRNGAGIAGARGTAFLYANPGTTKYFPFLNLNGCTDMRDKSKWPMAQNPVGERTYLDPGTVTVTGGPSAYTLPRRIAGNDPFARNHPADQWFFDPFVSGDSDGLTFLPDKRAYDVTFGGSTAMGPAQVYDNALYMPADFALTSPGSAPLPLPAGTDQTFTWTQPDDAEPAGVEVLSLVGFTGGAGPVVICVEKDDGSVTVPGAMIDVVRTVYNTTAFPAGGTLARQKLTHQVRELRDANGPTGRRIDFIAVWCYATSFTVP